MVKVKFIATAGFNHYHDMPDWKDGDEREVPEGKAEYLTTTFPENFFKVEVPKAKVVDSEVASNRMVRDSKNKGGR